jgi:hypothetical protein
MEVKQKMQYTSDPAETEIMRMRYVRANEKIALLDALTAMRQKGA